MQTRVIVSLAMGLFSVASVWAVETDSTSPPAAASQPTDEWTGRKVLAKSADVVLHEAVDDKAPAVPLSTVGIWLTVGKAQDGWLQTDVGWVRAEVVVRDDQAVEYFTGELKRAVSAFAYIGRSRAWLNANEIDKADADVSEALRLEPRNARAYFARAAIAATQERADAELAAYDRAHEIDPRDPAVLAGRAHAWADRGEYDRAIADLDVAIDVLPRTSYFLVCRGHCWRERGDKDKALADLTKALELDPSDAHSLSVRAAIYFQKGELADALRDAERAIGLDAKMPHGFAVRGAIRVLQQDVNAALTDLDKSIRLDATQPFAHAYRGWAHYLKGDHDAAILDLTQAISLNPDDAASYFRRAQLWSLKGDQPSAIIDLTQCLKLRPGNVEAYVARGQCRLASNLDEAMHDFEAALKLNPKHVGALVGQGWVWEQKGEQTKAIEALTAAIDVSPGLADLYERRADLRRDRGEHDLAIDDLAAALRIDPKNTDTLLARSDLWSRKGELGKAIDDCRAALAIDPKELMAYYYMAMAHSHAGQTEEALKDFDAALKVDPEDSEIRFLRDYELFNQGKFDLALADLDAIIKAGKHADGAYCWRGYFWYLRQNWEKAAADYSEAIRLGERNVSLLSGRAQCWLQLREFDKAIEDADEALRLDPKSQEAAAARQQAVEAKSDPSKEIAPPSWALHPGHGIVAAPEAGDLAASPQIELRGPDGLKLAYESEVSGEFYPEFVRFPVRLPLVDGGVMRFKLTRGDDAKVLYLRLESPQHAAILRVAMPPLELTQADLDAALSGNEVTKVLVMRIPEGEEREKAEFEVVSRVGREAAVAPHVAASRGGTVVATLSVGTSLSPPFRALADDRLVALSLRGPKGLGFALESASGKFEDQPASEAQLALLPGVQIRFKLSGSPARELQPLYALLTIPRERPPKADLPPEADVSLILSDADLRAAEGTLVTRVVYLAGRVAQNEMPRVESLSSAQMDPGKDPIAEASGRGTILATMKLSSQLADVPVEPGGLAPGLDSVAEQDAIPFSALPEDRPIVLLRGPRGLNLALESDPGKFDNPWIAAELGFAPPPGIELRLKLSGSSLPTKEPVYGLLSLSKERPPKADLPPGTALSITLSDADLKAAAEGKIVTCVAYVAAPATPKSAAEIETMFSTRMDPGTDPVAEASRRGTILATLKLSKQLADLPVEPSGRPRALIPAEQESD